MRHLLSYLPLALLPLLPLIEGCNKADKPVVVVYSSVDDEVARPLCEQFELETGIHVELTTDAEKAKSSGLLNRLIAEADRPVCDVFLSEDPVRSAVLKRKGISEAYDSPSAVGLPPEFSDPEHHWTGVSARARVLVVNKKHPIFVKDKVPLPTSVYDMINPKFKGLTCIGNPLFGTTTMHCLALFQHLGDEKARDLFEKMLQNEVHMLDSDGAVAEAVDKDQFAFGLTDNDDGMEAIKESRGQKNTMVVLDEKGLGMLAPDAPVLIKKCPHPENARKFIDFFLKADTEAKLSNLAKQIPLRPGVPRPEGFPYPPFEAMRGIKVDYNQLAEQHDVLVQGYLKEWAERNKLR